MQTILGLDIGHYSVKALRLRVTHRGFEALGFDEEIRDTVSALPEQQEGVSEAELRDALHEAEDEALTTALLELRGRGALEADRVCVSMPPDLVLSSRFSFPFSDPRQIQAVAPAEFEEVAPLPVSELLLRHHMVGPSVKQVGENDVLIAGVKQDDLSVFLDLWRSAQVDPHFVVMGDAVMLRLAPYLLKELTEPFAVVDLGHRFTRVVCVEPDGGQWRLGYARSFQFGGQDLTRALAEVLRCSAHEAEEFKHKRGFVSAATLVMGMDDLKVSDTLKKAMEPLKRELRRTFQAHMQERRNPVTRLFLCGGTSRLRGLPAYLSDYLGVSVEPLPIAGAELSTLNLAGAEVMAQALALALREAPSPGPQVDLNFRTGRFEHKGSKGWFREQAVGMFVLGALFLCALGSLFGTRYYAVTQQHAASQEALERTTQRLFGQKVTSEKKIRDLMGGSTDDGGLLPRRSAYDYFYEVYSRPAQGTKLELTSVDVDLFRQLIKIQATTDSAANVDPYVESLGGFECFKGQIQKGNTNATGEVVKFDLTIAPECPDAKKADPKDKDKDKKKK
jgi:general secretion pathway protein L